MGDFRFENVHRGQLVVLGLCAAQAESGGVVHEAELGVEVGLLLRVGELVPCFSDPGVGAFVGGLAFLNCCRRGKGIACRQGSNQELA